MMESNLPDRKTPPGIQPGRLITVNGITYERFPIKVPELIAFGENLDAILNTFVKPHFKPGDWSRSPKS